MLSPTIPPKNRLEWRKLLSGDIQHKFKNFVLQLRVYQLHKDIMANKIDEDKALDELYLLCSKYALVVQEDMRAIFKSW